MTLLDYPASSVLTPQDKSCLVDYFEFRPRQLKQLTRDLQLESRTTIEGAIRLSPHSLRAFLSLLPSGIPGFRWNGEVEPEHPSPAPPAATEPYQRECVICMDAQSSCAIIHGDTAHLCLCEACGQRAMSDLSHCPMCREAICTIVTVY